MSFRWAHMATLDQHNVELVTRINLIIFSLGLPRPYRTSPELWIGSTGV